MQAGNYLQALVAFRQALRLDPGNATIHFLVSGAYKMQGAMEDCEDSLKLAINFDPALYEAHLSLGNIYLHRHEYGNAIKSYLNALDGCKENSELFCNLGLAFFAQGENDEAEIYLRHGMELDENNPLILNNLAVLLSAECRTQEALEVIERAISIYPDYENANKTYATALRDMCRTDDALKHIDDFLARVGESAAMHWQKSLVLLVSGRFEDGWTEYEWGFEVGERPVRAFPYSVWDGSSLQGKTILVYGEQGLGDEIIFASCLPDVIKDAGKVIVECNKRLEQLFSRSFPQAIVHGGYRDDSMEWLAKVPEIDVQISIGSLPLHYRRSWHDFPAHNGYLKADSVREKYWQDRLQQLGPGLKIGISWQGGTRRTRQNIRSIALSDWAPLLTQESVHFISLQYTDVSDEISRLYNEKGIRLNHWQEAIDDYDDTAALVSALDIVITVQTSVAHLCGALGKEVWILLNNCPEWRYMIDTNRMPWYPNAILFRRHRDVGWGDLFSQVAACLQDRIQKQENQ
jgi:tetratricopeptide (TPR) repeat protein